VYRAFFKRLIDVVLSAVALLFLSPILLVTALIIRLKLGSPALFRQTRPGLSARPFEILKFRTMSAGPGTDAERLGPLGRYLRAASLDELPGLFNVLRGDMSLVGPRPLLMDYLPRYDVRQARRHETRPGVTGWAQVNGRNAISWEEKFELDVWYVDHVSFLLDLKILLLTLAKVVRRDGISAQGHATMPEFMGSGGRTK
jgi:lipopolysaccharide/colanic/teichoic acid biosynthesis glycosyltransferase